MPKQTLHTNNSSKDKWISLEGYIKYKTTDFQLLKYMAAELHAYNFKPIDNKLRLWQSDKWTRGACIVPTSWSIQSDLPKQVLWGGS